MLDINTVRAWFAEYLADHADKRHSLDAALMHVVERAYKQGADSAKSTGLHAFRIINDDGTPNGFYGIVSGTNRPNMFWAADSISDPYRMEFIPIGEVAICWKVDVDEIGEVGEMPMNPLPETMAVGVVPEALWDMNFKGWRRLFMTRDDWK